MSATPEAQYGLGGAPVRRIDNPVQIVLCSAPRPLRPVPTTSDAEVCRWYAERVPLVAPPSVLPLLDQWALALEGKAPRSFPGWRPEGPGRTPDDAVPLIALLRDHAGRGEPFTFNSLYREKQGGRSYPFVIPEYKGPLTITGRQYGKAGHGRSLLSAIRRDVRALLEAPDGWSLLELDFRTCHAAIGLALSGDEQLARDLDSDFHQVVGELFVRLPTEAERRDAGKRINNAMLFGLTPVGLAELTKELLGRPPADGTGVAVWSAWWSRYPKLEAFRKYVEHQVTTAQIYRQPLVIVAPSGRISRFAPSEVQGGIAKGSRPAPGRDHVWRSVFSACFRAVEGDLLDATLRRFNAKSGGGRLVLPIYDGALVAAPDGTEEVVRRALLEAAEGAVVDVGVPKLRAIVNRRSPREPA